MSRSILRWSPLLHVISISTKGGTEISSKTNLSHISDDNIHKVHEQTNTQSLEVVTKITCHEIYPYIKWNIEKPPNMKNSNEVATNNEN